MKPKLLLSTSRDDPAAYVESFTAAGGDVTTQYCPQYSDIYDALVLCGGCLLRFMVVNTDDRAPLPGEEKYMGRVANHKYAFAKRWDYNGENEF